jgi:hypothetical protein
VINIEALTAVSTNSEPTGQVSVAGSTLTGLSEQLSLSQQFQTIDITCADTVNQPGKQASGSFITGFFYVETSVPLSITAVYSAQGCDFLLPVATAILPLCSGPTAIDVVPQQPALTAVAIAPAG